MARGTLLGPVDEVPLRTILCIERGLSTVASLVFGLFAAQRDGGSREDAFLDLQSVKERESPL